MHQRTTQRQLLLHTTRKSPRLTIRETFYLLVDGLNGVVPRIDRRTKKGGEELKVFPDR